MIAGYHSLGNDFGGVWLAFFVDISEYIADSASKHLS